MIPRLEIASKQKTRLGGFFALKAIALFKLLRKGLGMRSHFYQQLARSLNRQNLSKPNS
ncbi:hypothetical protein H6F78_11220 [Coleofasciculus sp. FACHB-64]|uniref:hypothetical protein n=1 Tax=Cyanophyceae TaxID=3028117 RepID=UPI001688DC29|nr:hypothetical protein [Coleofasciculus sp. FACHB-64]MBD2046157.1 hypothetical protein [Coleofasciculus sp. FACHB-64]